MISKQIIEDIISKAVFAPSGDNSQPWHFVVSGDAVSIYNYPEKDLPFYNYKQCGSYVAHGALLENMGIVASTHGYTCLTNLFPQGNQSVLVAIVTFIVSPDVSVDLLADYVSKRATNRRPYSKEVISSEIKGHIHSANREKKITIQFIDDENKIQKISLASVSNEMTVLTTKKIHNFFFRHVIWSAKEEKVKRSGLFVKTLEMPKPQEVAFRLASFWPIMKIANVFGIAKKIAADNARLFQASSSFIAFLSAGDAPEDFIALGRSMQRVWLACTRENIAVQPITGVLFLYRRVRAHMAEGIADKQQQLISSSYEEIRRQCNAGDNEVLFLLRIGIAPPPTASSSRLAPIISY